MKKKRNNYTTISIIVLGLLALAAVYTYFGSGPQPQTTTITQVAQEVKDNKINTYRVKMEVIFILD